MIASSTSSELPTYLIIMGTLLVLSIPVAVVLRVRGNRIRGLDEDPRVARSTIILGADLPVARVMIEAAILRLDVRHSSYNENVEQYSFRTGMTWRTWWQDTTVRLSNLTEGLTELEVVSVTSDTQTIGALAGGKAAIKKFVTAMHTVNPSIGIQGAEPTGVA